MRHYLIKMVLVSNKNIEFKVNKAKLKEILLSSTSHGIPNLIKNEHRSLKILWIICIFFSFCGCVYFLINSIDEYLDFNKITTISVINNQPAIFPTISICHRKTLSLDLKSIDYCRISYDLDCLNNPEKYFESFNDTHYGQCLRFNSGKNYKKQSISLLESNYPGSDDGLWLNFKLNSITQFSKLNVRIHNHTKAPFNMANEDIKISSGKTYYIPLEILFTQRLGEPYNDCLKDPLKFHFNKTLINYFIKSGRAYSQKECYQMCFNLQYQENNQCNCTDQMIENVFDKCFEIEDTFSLLYNCSQKFRRDFSINSKFKICENYCPSECDSISYSFSSYTYDYPISGNISENLRVKYFDSNFDTYEEVQVSYFSFVVFYKNLNYVLITEKPNMELADLISNIGGILGVFLGVSFLSFIEIIEILFFCF